MTTRRRIVVASDFSKYPAGRFLQDGPFSGQQFRQDHLVPALTSSDQVEVDLDGTLGYGSSFLEEAFGGLVRIERLSASELHAKLAIVSREDALLVAEVWSYIDEATPGEEDEVSVR